VQTVPRRGYKFLVSVEPVAGFAAAARLAGGPPLPRATTDVNLHKALWANIAEMRLAEERRRRLLIALTVAVLMLALAFVFKMLV
jgi:hypothetical protein